MLTAYPIAKQILPDIGLAPCASTEWCYYASSKLPLTPGQYLVTVTTQGDVSLVGYNTMIPKTDLIKLYRDALHIIKL